MKKYYIYYILLPVLLFSCAIYQRIQDDHRWSIGIYEGPTLFDLAPGSDTDNPVLTADDVVDIPAVFVADPFLIFKNEKYFMFFEVLNRKNNQGEIAYAESTDGKKWHYRKVVLREPFHLSYPYVFEWNGDFYMIPESYQDDSVRLYKALEFPDKWEFAGKLLTGDQYSDASIFRYQDKWWMFVSDTKSNVLNLYFSDELTKGWRPHAKNPILKSNKHFSRPAGRVIMDKGKLFRFAQDDDPDYGIQVFAFEIVELSETAYADRLVSEKPIITKTGTGWNAAGMHHVDPWQTGDGWMSAVDGRCR
jgi:hypothetical protein